MENKELKININTVQVLSVIDGKTIYTIWAEDYDLFREAFKKSEDYKKEQEQLESKYRSPLRK